MNCDSVILSNQGFVYHAYIFAGWHLFLPLFRALCSWHDWHRQCFGWLRAVGLVSGGRIFQLPGARLAGVYFQANGKFYAMGGRTSDTAGSEFTHPFEYDPNTNTWTTKGATYPDNMVNNIACGVLTDAGTPVHLLCGRLGRLHPHGHDRSRLPL